MDDAPERVATSGDGEQQALISAYRDGTSVVDEAANDRLHVGSVGQIDSLIMKEDTTGPCPAHQYQLEARRDDRVTLIEEISKDNEYLMRNENTGMVGIVYRSQFEGDVGNSTRRGLYQDMVQRYYRVSSEGLYNVTPEGAIGHEWYGKLFRIYEAFNETLDADKVSIPNVECNTIIQVDQYFEAVFSAVKWHWENLASTVYRPLTLFLRGIAILAVISNQDLTFTTVATHKECIALTNTLNHIALLGFNTAVGETATGGLATELRKHSQLTRSFSKAINGTKLMMRLIDWYSAHCNIDCLYLLLALVVVKGCMDAIDKQPISVELCWIDVVKSFRWTEEHDAGVMVLLSTFANDYRLGMFKMFSTKSVKTDIVRLIKRTCPQADGSQSSCGSSPAWIQSNVAEAIFRALGCIQDCSTDVGNIIQKVSAGTQNLSGSNIQLRTTAAYYLQTDQLLLLINQVRISFELLAKILKTVYDSVNSSEHPRKQAGLGNIRQALFSHFFTDIASVGGEGLKELLCRLQKSDHNYWAHKCVAQAILEGNETQLQLEDADKCIVPLADLCDKYIDTIGPDPGQDGKLTALLSSIHTLGGCHLDFTIHVLKKSKNLCSIRLQQDQEVVWHGHFSFDSLSNSISGACSAVDMISEPQYRPVSSDAFELLWRSYCNGFSLALQRQPMTERLAAMRDILSKSDYFDVASQRGNKRAILLKGMFISSFLEGFFSNDQDYTDEILQHAPRLAILLRACVEAQKDSRHLPTDFAMMKLRVELQRLSNRVNNEDYHQRFWSRYKDCVSRINDLLMAFDLPTVTAIHGWADDDDVTIEYNNSYKLLQWLHKKQVSEAKADLDQLTEKRGRDTTTLKDLKQSLQKIQRDYIEALSRPVDGNLPLYMYIVETVAESLICEYFSEGMIGELSMTSSNWKNVIIGHVTKIHGRLCTLLSGGTPISKVCSIVSNTNSNVPIESRSLMGDICLLQETTAHKSDEEGIARLQRVLWMLCERKQNGLEGLSIILRKLHFSREDTFAQQLDKYLSPDHDTCLTGEATMKTVDLYSRDLYEVLKDLQSWHWKLFRLLGANEGRPTEVLEYYRSEMLHGEHYFRTRLEIISNHVEGVLGHWRLISSFQNAIPVFQTLTSDRWTSATEMLQGLVRIPPIALDILEDITNNLPSIKMLIKSAMEETSFNRARKEIDGLMKQATVHLHHENGEVSKYTCSYTDNETAKPVIMEREELQELRLCLPYFYLRCSESGVSESMQGIDAYRLSTLLTKLDKLYGSILRHQNCGDFGFLYSSGTHEFPFDLNEMKIDELSAAGDDHRRAWDEQLRDLRQACAALHHYSDLDVGRMLRCGDELHRSLPQGVPGSTSANARLQAFKLLSYIVTTGSLLQPQGAPTLAELFEAVVDGQERDREQLLLMALSKFTLGSPSSGPSVANTQFLCTLSGKDSARMDVLMALLNHQLGGSHLSSAQFLFCADSSTVDDVQNFFQTVEHSSNSQFVICGVNLLPSKCQSLLLSYQERMSKSRAGLRLYYLAYTSQFFSLWPKRDYFRELSLQAPSEPGWAATQVPGLEVCVVTGKAGAGKSHFIREQCSRREVQHPAVLSIVDCGNTAVICEQLCTIYTSSCQGRRQSVAFKIGQDACLDDVNWIFFMLFWCRSLSGKDHSIFSLLGDSAVRWTWYVEVPDRFNERDQSNESAVEPVKDCLPFLLALDGRVICNVDEVQLSLDDEMQQVAAVLHANRFGYLDSPDICGTEADRRRDEADDRGLNVCQFLQCPRLDSELECRIEVERYLRELDLLHSNRIQTVHALHYLHKKWEEVMSGKSLCNAHVEAYSNFATCLITQYKKEAAYVCQKELNCSYHKCTQAFLVFDGKCHFQVLQPAGITEPDSLYVKGRTQDIPDRSLLGVAHTTEAQDAGTGQRELEMIQSVFGFNSIAEVKQVMNEEQFVLTPDFAFKLIWLMERSKIGTPVILEGDTGTGKTYLLRMFTTLIRRREEVGEHAPVRKWCSWLSAFVLEILWENCDNEFRMLFANNCSPTYPKETNHELQGIQKMLSLVFTKEEAIASWRQHFLKKLPDRWRCKLKREALKKIKHWLTEFQQLELRGKSLQAMLAKDDNDQPDMEEMSNDDACEMLEDWLTVSTRSLFRKRLVHPGMTRDDIQKFIDEVRALAMQVGPQHCVVAFFDELNTSRYVLNDLKELFVTGKLDRNPSLGDVSNIFFVAAINPMKAEDRWNTNYFQFSDDPVTTDSIPDEAHPTHWQEELGLEYNVHSMPGVLNFYKWKYASLLKEEELQCYTKEKMTLLKSNELLRGSGIRAISDSVFSLLSSFLFYAFSYCRNKVKKSFVSQRDEQRVFKLIPYFWKLELATRRRQGNMYTGIDEALERCILQAVALAFYVRLPVEPGSRFPDVCRRHFDEWVTDRVKIKENETRDISLAATLEKCINEFVTRTNFYIPIDVGLTSALKENIFCMVPCIQQKIPFAIIGEPGSSKTLAYRIVSDNLKGSSSRNEFCKQFAAVDSLFCQCSPDTTTEQIKAKFKEAHFREGNRENEHGREHDQETHQDCAPEASHRHHAVTTVFVDEAGLPSMKQNRMVMKVLHNYLDEQKVSFVALSNHWFDAANTNRMLTVFRNHASRDDLLTLAYGCLNEKKPERMDRAYLDDLGSFISGICSGYQEVIHLHPLWFHQRDFIGLFRCLRRLCILQREARIVPSPAHLQQAVEENFNGLTEVQVEQVADIFFRNVSTELQSFPSKANPIRSQTPTAVVLSINSHIDSVRLKGNTFCNVTSLLAPRFNLLIDAGGCGYALVDYLLQMGILKHGVGNTKVFKLSRLSSDDEERRCANLLAKIRLSLIDPCTIVILNSPKLHGYLYELFNQGYCPYSTDGKLYAYTNIAMKDTTFPCQVHPEFRCIVILSEELAQKEKTPFLSRFAKFTIHPCQGVRYVLSPNRSYMSEPLSQAYSELCRFRDGMGDSRFFGCGSAQKFTSFVDCVFLSQIVKSDDGNYHFDEMDQRDAMIAMVVKLFGMMPVEAFLSALPLLPAQDKYTELYFKVNEACTLASTLRSVMKREERDSRLSKVLLFSQSFSLDLHDLVDGEVARVHLGDEISSKTVVNSCSDFAAFNDVEHALTEFLQGASECFIILVDTLKTSQAVHTVSALKQMVDEQCVLELAGETTAAAQGHTAIADTGAVARGPKTIVLLLHSIVPSSSHQTARASFLNGWQSRFTSVPNQCLHTPVSIPGFLVISGVLSIDDGRTPEVYAEQVLNVLHQDKQRIVSSFQSSILPIEIADSNDIPPEDAVLFTTNPAQVQREDVEKAVAGLLDRFPRIINWLAGTLWNWIMRSGASLVSAHLKRFKRHRWRKSIVDTIYSNVTRELGALVDTIVSAIASSIVSLIRDNFEPALVDELLLLVTDDIEGRRWVRSAMRSRRASTVVTPFFHHVLWQIDNVTSWARNKDYVSLRAQLTGKLSSVLESEDFVRCYCQDYIAEICCWSGPGHALDWATSYIIRKQPDLPEESNGIDVVACLHADVANNKADLVALMHAVVDLKLLFGPDRFEEERQQILQPPFNGELKWCCKHLIEQLFNALREIVARIREAPDEASHSEELHVWQQRAAHLFLYWYFTPDGTVLPVPEQQASETHSAAEWLVWGGSRGRGVEPALIRLIYIAHVMQGVIQPERFANLLTAMYTECFHLQDNRDGAATATMNNLLGTLLSGCEPHTVGIEGVTLRLTCLKILLDCMPRHDFGRDVSRDRYVTQFREFVDIQQHPALTEAFKSCLDILLNRLQRTLELKGISRDTVHSALLSTVSRQWSMPSKADFGGYYPALYQPSGLAASFQARLTTPALLTQPLVHSIFSSLCNSLRQKNTDTAGRVRDARLDCDIITEQSGDDNVITPYLVLTKCAAVYVAFDAVAEAIAASRQGDSCQPEVTRTRRSLADLIQVHGGVNGNEWKAFLLCRILESLPVELPPVAEATRRLGEYSAPNLAELCGGLLPLEANIDRKSSQFRELNELNAVGEGQRALCSLMSSASGGEVASSICEWYRRQSEVNTRSLAEMQLFLEVFHSFCLQQDEQVVRRLPQMIEGTALLKRSLSHLLATPQVAVVTEFTAILTGHEQLRTLLMETLAAAIGSNGDGSHLRTCVLEPSALRDTALFGATSARSTWLGGSLSHQHIDDFFRMTVGGLPGFADEVQSIQTSLSYTGYILNAITTYAALCWNAVLFPEKNSLSTLLCCGEMTPADCVRHCLERVLAFVHLLPATGIQVPRLGVTLLVCASLQCQVATSHGGEASAFRRVYRDATRREKAERAYERDVCQRALAVMWSDMDAFLRAQCGGYFADTVWLQAKERSDRRCMIACIAAERHHVLAEVLSNFPKYQLLSRVASLISFLSTVHWNLRGQHSFADVNDGLTLKEAASRLHKVTRDRINRDLENAQADFEFVKTTLARFVSLSNAPATDDVASLTPSTQLKQIINFPAGASSVTLWSMVNQVLSWQNLLLDVCSRQQEATAVTTANEADGPTWTPEAQRCLRSAAQDAPLQIIELLVLNCRVLLQLDQAQLDELLALFCPMHQLKNDDGHVHVWEARVDLDAMEHNLVTGFIGKMRRIDWGDLAMFEFTRNETDSPAALLKSSLTGQSPLADTQQCELSQLLCSLSPTQKAELQARLSDLALQLVDGRMAMPGGQDTNLYDIVKPLNRYPQGSVMREEAVKVILSALHLNNLAATLDHLDSHLDEFLDSNESCTVHIRQMMNVEMLEPARAEVATLVETLLAADSDIENVVFALDEKLPELEQNPGKQLNLIFREDATDRDSGPVPTHLQLLSGLPESVLGYHYKHLVRMLNRCMEKRTFERQREQLTERSPLDPCEFSQAEASAQGRPVALGTLWVTFLLRHFRTDDTEEVNLRCQKTELIQPVLDRAREQANKQVNKVMYLELDGSDDPLLLHEVGQDEINTLSGDELELRVTVVHK